MRDVPCDARLDEQRDANSNIRSDEPDLLRSGFLKRAGEASILGGDFFREVLDVLPAAIYITDASGRITYFNEAAAKLWGRRPELGVSEWCGSWKLFWPDGRPMPHDECPMALAIKQDRPVRGIEAMAERPDGGMVSFLPYPAPIYDASGELIGAVNMLVEISDRKRSEEHAQRLAAIVESSDDAIVSKDLNGVINSWNRGAERLFGYKAEEVIGKPITILIPADRQDEEAAILGRIRRGERVDHFNTVRKRKDGSLVEISLTVSPIKNAEGRIIGASKTARDITEFKRAQEQQRLLLREMKHRVKNTLTTVQVIAAQTFHGASSSEREAFAARLSALANAHDLLTADNWQGAALYKVVAKALAAFQERHRERVLIEGPKEVWLDANKSLLVTMALHELATNAVKYGALSNGGGQVRVAWELAKDDPSRLRLCWQESGGPAVKPPADRGFGSFLIERALKYELGAARFEFDPRGLVCKFEVAL